MTGVGWLNVVGYAERWSAAPGESLTFYVSCRLPTYKAQLVRLVHGDRNPAGPGPKEEVVAGVSVEEQAGQIQTLPLGSCMRVEGLPALGSMTFSVWLWPTLRLADRQYVLSICTANGEHSCALYLTEDGYIELRVRSGGQSVLLKLPGEAEVRQWIFLAVTMDSAGQIVLYRRTRDFSASASSNTSVAAHLPGTGFDAATALILGAHRLERTGRSVRPTGALNGKLSCPLLFSCALSPLEVERLALEESPPERQPLARWDFASDCATERVPDISGNGYVGVTINRPGRLVTGHNFTGRALNPCERPWEFNAIHFHDDDLADAAWEPSFKLTLPEGLRSGIYAAKLTADQDVDYVPFVVRPAPKSCRPAVAFLVPTLTYMAYANSLSEPPADAGVPADRQSCMAERAYVRNSGMRSTYDLHTDGSGVTNVTMLRPTPTGMRPGWRSPWNDSPQHLAADLYTIDWLESKGIQYDVLTDHDLHETGLAALAPYRVVISGSHAEYWTENMLNSLESYLQGGGRFVYLSGNGLYWVAALSEAGTVMEVRRCRGTRTWSAEPGEEYLSLTGEPGGLWRDRGRAPQRYVGVGFAAEGDGRGRPYRRLPGSHDPRARFIFEGVDAQSIGDFPVLAGEYGAAGVEIDRADLQLGTPAHALLLASASFFDDPFNVAIEELRHVALSRDRAVRERARADMVFFETPSGGAVFSVGSIAWNSALSFNNYQNDVSRITQNVVLGLSKSGPLPNG